MFISGNVPSLDESPNYTVNVPKQARVMTNFLDSIIDAAQKEKPGSLLHTTIKCFKKSCKGTITIEIESDSSDILWKCTHPLIISSILSNYYLETDPDVFKYLSVEKIMQNYYKWLNI